VSLIRRRIVGATPERLADDELATISYVGADLRSQIADLP
jgi:hypothetical protein